MRQSYYLRQRKTNGLISIIFVDNLTGKRTERATGTNDEKKAHATAHNWLANGLPEKPSTNNIARTTGFCDYLYQFWDFDTSEYFREQETMGKEPQPDHAYEMQRVVKRYFQFARTRVVHGETGRKMGKRQYSYRLERIGIYCLRW